MAPQDSGKTDYIGGFAVTAGHGIDPIVADFEKQNDDYNSILLKALADRLAEAFAERMHERVRREFWAYAPDEALDNASLIREKYRGIRPAPGYPACPDHSQKPTLFQLLDAEAEAGIILTESNAMLRTRKPRISASAGSSAISCWTMQSGRAYPSKTPSAACLRSSATTRANPAPAR